MVRGWDRGQLQPPRVNDPPGQGTEGNHYSHIPTGATEPANIRLNESGLMMLLKVLSK